MGCGHANDAIAISATIDTTATEKIDESIARYAVLLAGPRNKNNINSNTIVKVDSRSAQNSSRKRFNLYDIG